MRRLFCPYLSLDQTETAVESLLLLKREFPGDPEVLYTSTHFFSELASRSSQELAARAPTSPQAQQLEAEALFPRTKSSVYNIHRQACPGRLVQAETKEQFRWLSGIFLAGTS
jgi:hypothetical protein